MSTSYDFELEVTTKKINRVKLQKFLRDEGIICKNIQLVSLLDNHFIATTTRSLCGGEDPETSNNEIVALIRKLDPEAKVETRWHYAEWEWDHEYSTEPEKTEEKPKPKPQTYAEYVASRKKEGWEFLCNATGVGLRNNGDEVGRIAENQSKLGYNILLTEQAFGTDGKLIPKMRGIWRRKQ